jgi:hypothetical protein
MSLLSLTNNAIADTSFVQVSQIFGNPSQTAIALLGCARRAVRDLIRHNNGGWTALVSEWNFQTNAITVNGDVAQGSPTVVNIANTAGLQAGIFTATGGFFPNNSVILNVDSVNQLTLNQNATASATGVDIVFAQAGYPLPSDFGSFVDQTMWDRSRYWAMRGPMNPQQWQMYKSSIIGKASIQRRWRVMQPPGGTQGQAYFFIDPAPTDDNSPMVFEYNSNAPILTGTTPHQEWTSDADTCKLDEYVIELGVRYRMLKRFGYDYSVELDEFERAVDVYMANDGGMAILSMSPESDFGLLGPYNVQEGNYPGD